MKLFIIAFGIAVAQPVEKLLLTTDKQWYYPGEPIWISVNSFNACSGVLSQVSAVAYVELVNVESGSVGRLKLKIEDAQATGALVIDEETPGGTYELVAYTNWMKNVGPEIFVRKPIQIVNPLKPGKIDVNLTKPAGEEHETGALNIEVSNMQPGKREPVKLKFATGARTRVIVSVHRIDELEKGTLKTFLSSTADPCTFSNPRQLPFILERRGHIITGKVTDARTQRPVAGVNGYLSSLRHPDRLFMATSDSLGVIEFEVDDLDGQTELVAQPDPKGAGSLVIDLISPFAGKSGTLQKAEKTNDVLTSNPEVINDGLVSSQVQKVFASYRNTAGKVIDRLPFYGKPDGLYLMSDYAKFNTVEELLREYVVNVGVRKRNGKSYPVVYDQKTTTAFKEAPLVLVNGIPFFETWRLLEMDAESLFSIGVVANKFVLGQHVFHGIIDVRLKAALKELPPEIRKVDYKAMEPAKTFAAPVYDSEEKRANRKPDFRNVLYWNPSLYTDNSGNGSVDFYTSDLEGRFVVVVQSISREGQVKLDRSFIEVK